MTATESYYYAQIEKEALAITWGCEKFNDYILGMKFHFQTDHKPLISLLREKELARTSSTNSMFPDETDEGQLYY